MVRGTDFDKNSHLLLASDSFPEMLSAGSGVSGVSQGVSYCLAETVGG